MLFDDHLVVVRGGGDLASGAVHRLRRAGFPVIVLELEHPLAIRQAVSFAAAVSQGSVAVDGVSGILVKSIDEAADVARSGEVAVAVEPELPPLDPAAAVVVDARMAKRNLGTTIEDAPLVVALGPGFVAAVDCHVVIETQRGHRLGRIIESGSAAVDTGVPGAIEGRTVERIVRAPADGTVRWEVAIGDIVERGAVLGHVDDQELTAGIDGVVRGLLAERVPVHEGLKIGDIDPRGDPQACFEVSDKARLVGAGVLEAVLAWIDGHPS